MIYAKDMSSSNGYCLRDVKSNIEAEEEAPAAAISAATDDDDEEENMNRMWMSAYMFRAVDFHYKFSNYTIM